MKKIAVSGSGFMGKTHTMNILKNPDLKLVAIVNRMPDNIWKNPMENQEYFSTDSMSKESPAAVNIYPSFEECLLNRRSECGFFRGNRLFCCLKTHQQPLSCSQESVLQTIECAINI
ncbi:MAG: hypothetical protein KFF73_09990 [Cyclobacteriaceae bacterium]|nr:hypothetical protein [Cyclobacteriaceae bacterium]